MTICGLRTIGNEKGLLTPSKDSPPADVDARASAHEEKVNATNKITRTPFPKSHNVDDADTKRCVHGAENKDTASKRDTPSTSRQTFSARNDAFESTPRRRKKLLTAGEGGKLAHTIKDLLAHFHHVSILESSIRRLGRECQGNTLVERLSRFDS